MPKSLREFSIADWRRLRPLTQAVKSWRYRRVDDLYRRRGAAMGSPGAVAASIGGCKVLVTVAFADPQLLRWQVRLVRRFVTDATHIVVDNTPADDIAALNAQIAGDAGIAYLRAPPNPWASAASRSHGIVLNWTWHNIIRPGAPAAFGFIDHDIFPTATDDPFAPLAAQDVYGVVRTAGPRWFLWAGFCMFRFAAVQDKLLDFGQDWFIGLDTGGGNWKSLYCRIDRHALREPTTTFVPFKPGTRLEEGPLQWCGSWLHEIGLMGDPGLAGEKRATVARLLAPYLDDIAMRPAIGAV